MNPVNTRRYPGHDDPFDCQNPCRIAVKVVGYGGHVLSPPSLQPSNPPPLCRCSLEIILLRFLLLLLLLSNPFQSNVLWEIVKILKSEFYYHIFLSRKLKLWWWLMWCIFDLHFVTLNPSPYLFVSFSHIPTSLSSDLKSRLHKHIYVCASVRIFGKGAQDLMVVDMEWFGYFRPKPFSSGVFLAHIPFTRFWRPNCACILLFFA